MHIFRVLIITIENRIKLPENVKYFEFEASSVLLNTLDGFLAFLYIVQRYDEF